MYLPLGQYSPPVTLGLVAASRPCFPREISERRTHALKTECDKRQLRLIEVSGRSGIIETREDAHEAARQLKQAGCDAAVLFLGNFSPEIEDAVFIKAFEGPVLLMAAEEESVNALALDRGDALCGLLSATLSVAKRDLRRRVHIPAVPLVSATAGAGEIERFLRIMRVVKGVRNATIALFGPRPRDFETCSYNLASLLSLGVEIEELGFFDLANEVQRIREKDIEAVGATAAEIASEIPNVPDGEFAQRLGAYERALLVFRERLGLSGATTQCWAEQEFCLRHAPCAINARLAARGFPVACENDAYSLVAELMGQYASNQSVTVLDLNHTIPPDLHPSLSRYNAKDLVGLFHCGNTEMKRLRYGEMKHQITMKRNMEPDSAPDISRGTLEGMIAASPITVMQIHGAGDGLRAYIMEGEFLDIDQGTYGVVGTAHLPGFMRFYRHVLLGRFHHHAGVAFEHCGGILYDAMRLLGIETIDTPKPAGALYPGENPF